MNVDPGATAICTHPGGFPDGYPAFSTAYLTAGFPGEELKRVGSRSPAKSTLEGHSSLDVCAHVYLHLKLPPRNCPGAEDAAGRLQNKVVVAVFVPPPADRILPPPIVL